MNKFPYCHVFDGQVVRAAAPGIGETWDRIQFASLYNQKYFPLHGEDKFPLWEGYIFESKIPLVVRIGLAARACGSGIGPSPSNSLTTLAFLRYRVFALIAQNPMKFRKGETEKAKVALICGTNTNNLFSRHQQWYICDTLLHTMWALGPIRIVWAVFHRRPLMRIRLVGIWYRGIRS